MKNFKEAKNIQELCKILGLPASEGPKVKMRVDLAVALSGTSLVEGRPAPGSTSQGTALPGDRAGAEVSELSDEGDFDASASVPREIVPVSALWKPRRSR